MKAVVRVRFPALAKTRLFQFPLIAVLLLVTGLLLNLLDNKAPSFLLITVACAGIGLTLAAEFMPHPNQTACRVLLQVPFMFMVFFAVFTYCDFSGYDHWFAYIAYLIQLFNYPPLSRLWFSRVRQKPPWEGQHPWSFVPFVLAAPPFAILPLVFGLNVFDDWPAFVIAASVICIAGCVTALLIGLRKQSLAEGRHNLIS